MKKVIATLPAVLLLACSPGAVERDVAQIHADTLTLDTHVDCLLYTSDAADD